MNATEWASGNIYIRPMPYKLDKVGDSIDGHAHKHDHTTIVLRGGIRIDAIMQDGRRVSREFFAPDDEHGTQRAHVLIKAGVVHRITSLVDHTVAWCIYSHRTAQGDVVQAFNGWEDAYGAQNYPTEAMVALGADVLRAARLKHVKFEDLAREVFEVMLKAGLGG